MTYAIVWIVGASITSAILAAGALRDGNQKVDSDLTMAATLPWFAWPVLLPLVAGAIIGAAIEARRK